MQDGGMCEECCDPRMLKDIRAKKWPRFLISFMIYKYKRSLEFIGDSPRGCGQKQSLQYSIDEQ